MIWMICQPCRVSYHSTCLPIGDEYVPQFPECPKCGEMGAETDIIYLGTAELKLAATLASRRLALLNILKAHILQLIEEIERNGGLREESFGRLEKMKTMINDPKLLTTGETDAARPH